MAAVVEDVKTPAAPKPAEKPAEKQAEKPAEPKPVADKPVEKPATEAPVGDQPAADPSKDGTPPAQPKAPEKYALTVPDDAKEFLSSDDLAFLETTARANDWTNEEAQAELDGHLQRATARLEQQSQAWEAQTKADPDYGGAQLDATKAKARAVVNQIRPEGHPRREAFLRFLNRGGAGNHIEVVSFLADLGTLMAEDTGGTGNGSAEPRKKSAEELMYPSMFTADGQPKTGV
jgi:hypothetical protein